MLMEWKVSISVGSCKFQPDSTCRTHSRHNRTFSNSKRSGSATQQQRAVRSETCNNFHAIHFIYFEFFIRIFFFFLGLLRVLTKRNGILVLIGNGVTKISFDSQPSSASVFFEHRVPNETSAFTIQCKLTDRKINSNLRISSNKCVNTAAQCEHWHTASPIKTKLWCPKRNKWMNIETICLHLKKKNSNYIQSENKILCHAKIISGLDIFCAWYFATLNE